MPVTGEVHSPTISNDVAAAIQPIDTTLSNIILVAGLGILTLAWTYVLHPRLLGIQRGALLSLLEKVEEAMHERTDLEGPLLDPRSSTTMNMELSLKRRVIHSNHPNGPISHKLTGRSSRNLWRGQTTTVSILPRGSNIRASCGS